MKRRANILKKKEVVSGFWTLPWHFPSRFFRLRLHLHLHLHILFLSFGHSILSLSKFLFFVILHSLSFLLVICSLHPNNTFPISPFSPLSSGFSTCMRFHRIIKSTEDVNQDQTDGGKVSFLFLCLEWRFLFCFSFYWVGFV